MKITWHGGTCFEIAGSSSDKENIVIQIDLKESEKKSGKFSADILLKTHNSDDVKPKADGQFAISDYGEYEIKGVLVQAIPSLMLDKKENIIYTVETEGIHVCHLGLFGENDLNDEQMESLGKVDILIVPIGGDETINYREAEKIIARLEPKIVIPMAYDPKKKDGLQSFLKAMGEKDIVPIDKLSIQKKNLSGKSDEEKTEVVVLESK
ncbi:MAG: MBL fold metallo-hydrolase [Candidatus Pacebacteria bacterium]|nr:MBL fold metallo-hydrolase [Candidatus Paceibacterota bacterium]